MMILMLLCGQVSDSGDLQIFGMQFFEFLALGFQAGIATVIACYFTGSLADLVKELRSVKKGQ